MFQYCVCDDQVIGYWQDEKEAWETTKPLENDLGRLETDMGYFSWETPKQAWGGGGARGGGGSLVNMALNLVLPLPDPLWARPDPCNSSYHIPG